MAGGTSACQNNMLHENSSLEFDNIIWLLLSPQEEKKVKSGYNMENAEERKKMKKIEKEEQLKKKLEQTMEEKMAADSKTVEGGNRQL